MAKQHVELWKVTRTGDELVEILETEDMGKALWKRIVALDVAFWRSEGYRIKTIFRKSKSGKVNENAQAIIFHKKQEVR